MKKITTQMELREEIALLEIKQIENTIALKNKFNKTFDSLRPVNLIKSTFKELTTSPDFKGNIINTTLGIGAGYLSKKIVIGSTFNPIKQILGTLLQLGVISIVSKNGDGIKLGAMKLFSNLFTKKNPTE